MTQFGVIVHYLRLTAAPLGQTFDYDWPLASIHFAARRRHPAAMLIGLVVGAWRLRSTYPLATFVAGWMLLILAPTSSVMPIADLAVERRMYLPLVGLMLLAAAWLYDLFGQLPDEWRQRPSLSYGAADRGRWWRRSGRSPGNAPSCGATPSPCTRTASRRLPATRARASISA